MQLMHQLCGLWRVGRFWAISSWLWNAWSSLAACSRWCCLPSRSLKLSWTFINYQLLYILIWFTRTAWCESNKKEDRRFDHPGLFGTGQGQPEHVQVLGMIWLFIRRYKRRTGFLVWKNEPKLLYMISKRVLLAHFEGWLETGAFYFLVH